MKPTASAAQAPWRAALPFLVLVLYAALAGLRHHRHVDVSDASLYRVLARHLVEDGAWVSLRYLPTAYPSFFEHLPFGLWPMALTIRLFGEAALPITQGGISALTVWLVGRTARRLAGDGAGLAAMVTLATTQNFFFIATMTLLDVPLLVGVALAVEGLTGDEAAVGRMVGLTAVGALVAMASKGPFGLVVPGAVWAARAIVDRSARVALAGAAGLALAVAPLVVFVGASPAWRSGYFEQQVLASLLGTRTDGDSADRLYAVQKTLEMFWPGLACLPATIWLFRDGDEPTRQAVAQLALASVIALVGLSLPARKVAHHIFVVFPLLAVWAGVAVGHLVERLEARWGARAMGVALLGLVAVSLVAGPLGVARWFASAPCVVSTELAADFDGISPGTAIEVVAADIPWWLLAALSGERDLVPQRVQALGDAGIEVRWAMVHEPLWPESSPFVEIRRARGWVLARRR